MDISRGPAQACSCSAQDEDLPSRDSRSPKRLCSVAAFSFLMLPFVLSLRSGAQQLTISGSVRDGRRTGISKAEVTLRARHFASSTRTDPEGNFSFGSISEASGSVRVIAIGF